MPFIDAKIRAIVYVLLFSVVTVKLKAFGGCYECKKPNIMRFKIMKILSKDILYKIFLKCHLLMIFKLYIKSQINPIFAILFK